jgi:Dolichyl-phosphate-mannose-protein mannosyltransferase
VNTVGKRALTVLLVGAILPALLSYAGAKFFAPLHGVTVSTGGKTWDEPTVDDAFDSLAKTKQVNANITGYVWIRGKPGYFLLKGIGRRQFFLDGKEVLELRRQPYGIQNDPVTPGLHRFRITCSPVNFGEAEYFVWTEDYTDSNPIPSWDLYKHSIGTGPRYVDLVARWLGILARLNLTILIAFILFVGLRNLFQKTGLIEPSNDGPAQSWVWITLFSLMLLVRLWGIGYQLPEGFHPDERMVDNLVGPFETGDLHPHQFFWSPGYCYLVAFLETIFQWIWKFDPTKHLIARTLSAVFSALSCWVLFSITTKLFNRTTAYWAAIFLGLTLMPVELGQEGIVEPSMVFFFLLAFRVLLELDWKIGKAGFALAGCVAGLAIGIKQTAAVLFIPAAVLFVPMLLQKPRGPNLAKVACWGAGCVAGFLLLSPYTILDYKTFLVYQTWQEHSQEGLTSKELFFVENKSSLQSFAMILDYLFDGMGYPIVIFAGLGSLILLWKSQRSALLILPLTFAYLTIVGLSRAAPYHYALLLCPLVALLASLALVAVSSTISKREYAVLILGALLLVSPLYNVLWLDRIEAGTDTRKIAESWCNRNLPPGSRVDYEVFGPRLLLPILNPVRLSLMHRDPWDPDPNEIEGHYYIYDSDTADIFEGLPQDFPVETEWFQMLKKTCPVIKEFHGNPYRMYNPGLAIYELHPPPKVSGSVKSAAYRPKN